MHECSRGVNAGRGEDRSSYMTPAARFCMHLLRVIAFVPRCSISRNMIEAFATLVNVYSMALLPPAHARRDDLSIPRSRTLVRHMARDETRNVSSNLP